MFLAGDALLYGLSVTVRGAAHCLGKFGTFGKLAVVDTCFPKQHILLEHSLSLKFLIIIIFCYEGIMTIL